MKETLDFWDKLILEPNESGQPLNYKLLEKLFEKEPDLWEQFINKSIKHKSSFKQITIFDAPLWVHWLFSFHPKKFNGAVKWLLKYSNDNKKSVNWFVDIDTDTAKESAFELLISLADEENARILANNTGVKNKSKVMSEVIKSNNWEALESLIDNGYDINERSDNGELPVFEVSNPKNLEIVLDFGADIWSVQHNKNLWDLFFDLHRCSNSLDEQKLYGLLNQKALDNLKSRPSNWAKTHSDATQNRINSIANKLAALKTSQLSGIKSLIKKENTLGITAKSSGGQELAMILLKAYIKSGVNYYGRGNKIGSFRKGLSELSLLKHSGWVDFNIIPDKDFPNWTIQDHLNIAEFIGIPFSLDPGLPKLSKEWCNTRLPIVLNDIDRWIKSYLKESRYMHKSFTISIINYYLENKSGNLSIITNPLRKIVKESDSNDKWLSDIISNFSNTDIIKELIKGHNSLVLDQLSLVIEDNQWFMDKLITMAENGSNNNNVIKALLNCWSSYLFHDFLSFEYYASDKEIERLARISKLLSERAISGVIKNDILKITNWFFEDSKHLKEIIPYTYDAYASERSAKAGPLKACEILECRIEEEKGGNDKEFNMITKIYSDLKNIHIMANLFDIQDQSVVTEKKKFL